MTISHQQIHYDNTDWTSWEYFSQNVLSRSEAGTVIICIIIGYLYWLFRPNTKQMRKRMKEIPQQQTQKKLKALILNALRETQQEPETQSAISKIKQLQQSVVYTNRKKTVSSIKSKVFKPKQEFYRPREQSLLYETREERDHKIKQQNEQQQKERQDKQKKLFEQNRRKLQEQKQRKLAQEAKNRQIIAAKAKQDNKSQPIRTDNRKPTIEQKIKQEQIKQTQSKKTTNSSSTKIEFSFANMNIPKTKEQVETKSQNNTSLPIPNTAAAPSQKPPTSAITSTPFNPDTKKKDNTIPSQLPAASIPAVPRSVAPVQPLNVRIDLSSEQYLQTLTVFAEKVTDNAEITTTMSNLGGARSSLVDLLTFSKSFLNSINKEDDKQLTTFAIKLYDSIVNKLISNSNLRDGLQRMPPKSRTNQAQKNSINGYILIINIYRLMGYEKVWNIVFGKTIKLLQFIYKRKQDLKNFRELELIANKYVEMRKQLSSKYLSRIDYLSYFLFGLTAFDPLLVFTQVEQKDRDVGKSRQEIQSWGTQWNYKEFWILADTFFRNKHDSYFKPIIYMNLLSVLYPRVYEYKCNPANFQRENELYKIILDLSKQYFSRYRTIKEIQVLSEQQEGIDGGYKWQYDGDDFKQGIKVLSNRITVQKGGQFKLNAREFQAKANIFYYFSKQK